MKFKHQFKVSLIRESTYIFKCENVNVRLDFLADMIRVCTYRDGERILPTWSVCPCEMDEAGTVCEMPYEGRDKLSLEGFELMQPDYEDLGDKVVFSMGSRRIEISLLNFEMSYYQDDKLLFKDREYISYNFEHELGRGACHFITREEDERIFGLGDKTGDVNKNKRSFRLSASDAMGFDARSSDPLYKVVPFYICENSVGSYGLYYDTYSEGAFDFGREINNYYNPFKSFRCEEETLCFYVMFGSTPEIINRFAHLRGRDLLPPKWTFQYCGSTMAYTDADDADRQLRGFVELCNKYDIHPGGFYMSSGYTQIGDKRCVFHWNLDKIPSPEGLSGYFRENGIEFIPNIKPCFLTTHPMYDEIARRGMFLKNGDGTPAIFPFWSGYGSYLDFTNKEAFMFWSDCVKSQLVDKGYYSTWNDNNEYDICDEDVYADGFGQPLKAKLIRPLFSYLMTMASVAAQPDDGRKNAVSRCGITGTSRIASTWTGDNRTSFVDFRYNHRMAMTMSMSGIYNFGQDIGGFAGPRAEKELFLRWIQYGIFTPRFVLHSWNSDGSSHMPWLYEDEMPTVKMLFDLRESFTSYIYNQIWRSTVDFNPVIYPLYLKHAECDVESDTFFFGDDIIACPVFDEGEELVEIDLPENNGNYYRGTQMVSGHYTENCSMHDEPVWLARGGSVVARDIAGETVYVVYPLELGTFTEDYLLDDGVTPLSNDNHDVIHFEIKCTADSVDVKASLRDGSDAKLKIQIVDGFGRVQ